MAGHYIAPDEPARTGKRKVEKTTADEGRDAGRADQETSHAGRPSEERTGQDSTGPDPGGAESSTTGSKMPR